MEIVEFIGCEGVGKTTLLNKLKTDANHDYKNFIIEEDIYKILALSVNKKENMLRKLALSLLLKSPYKKKISNYIIGDNFREKLMANKHMWQDFTQNLLTIENFNDPLKALCQYKWLYERIEKQEMYRNIEYDKTLILDTGVIHKATNILMGSINEINIEIIKNMVEAIPIKYKSIVFLDAPIETIYHRFKARYAKKKAWYRAMNYYSNDKELINKIKKEKYIIDCFANELTKYNNVIKIDSSNDFEIQINTVKKEI